MWLHSGSGRSLQGSHGASLHSPQSPRTETARPVTDAGASLSPSCLPCAVKRGHGGYPVDTLLPPAPAPALPQRATDHHSATTRTSGTMDYAVLAWSLSGLLLLGQAASLRNPVLAGVWGGLCGLCGLVSAYLMRAYLATPDPSDTDEMTGRNTRPYMHSLGPRRLAPAAAGGSLLHCFVFATDSTPHPHFPWLLTVQQASEDNPPCDTSVSAHMCTTGAARRRGVLGSALRTLWSVVKSALSMLAPRTLASAVFSLLSLALMGACVMQEQACLARHNVSLRWWTAARSHWLAPCGLAERTTSLPVDHLTTLTSC
jgi:hypothetical protein